MDMIGRRGGKKLDTRRDPTTIFVLEKCEETVKIPRSWNRPKMLTVSISA